MSTSPDFAITMPALHLHRVPRTLLRCYCYTAPMVTEATAASRRAEVDTSRPFQSVREAVEVFGDRRHGGGNGSSSNGSSMSPAAAASPSSVVLQCLKKLEEDLAEAKGEVVELRQRQAQMEVAVSSLSVQFSKGLAVYSGLSKGKEVAVVGGGEEDDDGGGHGRVRSDRWDESRAEEWVASLEYLPSLSEALAIKMVEDDLGDRRKERKLNKKKSKNNKTPSASSRAKKHKSGRISLPLVGGMFCSKKAKSR